MRHQSLIIAAAIALAGCAATGTGGPVKITDDTYMIGGIGGPFDYSGSAVMAKFFGQANEHCAGMGLSMVPVSSKGQDAFMSNYASAEVQYRCVKK